LRDLYKKINNMKVEIYKSGWGIFSDWKWRILNDDNEIAGYGRGFNTKYNVQVSLNDIDELITKYGINQFRIYKSGRFRVSWKWRLVAKNGRIVASNRGFGNINEAWNSVNEFVQFFKEKNNLKQIVK